jgi:NADH-quinone oxidoreductase subunit L
MGKENLAWAILLLPLFAAGIIALFTRKYPAASARISIVAVLTSFVLTWVFAGAWHPDGRYETAVDWITVGSPGLGGFNIQMGLAIDRLSWIMLLIVTGVGSAIHIYSFGYMREDPAFSRFFACLSMFTFSMLGIVLANNFLQMFVFWELVGLSSYLLIGFWYGKASAADAAKKAFLTNRIGDFGFLLGMIAIWTGIGSVNFVAVADALKANPGVLGTGASAIGILIFMGAMGKSAQFPLHVWLPDAMEGPTPVSALIHAATMVAAGVYMLCRVFFIYAANQAWPDWLGVLDGISALNIIAWIGGITALLAALMAVQQNDIKRILAYSTLSQLGYMVMTVGLSDKAGTGTNAAMYHLGTHAFFKALLFLGAGSVIHAMHHEQDIWNMGGLQKKLPVTFWTFLLGTLALMGIPPLSGFYSKDAILATAFEASPFFLFPISVIVAILTTFYMARLVLVAFFGKERTEAAHHAHESPLVMTGPLVFLGILTVFGGFFGLADVVAPAEHHQGGLLTTAFEPIGHAPMAALGGIGAALFGLFLAWSLYAKAERDPLPEMARSLSRAMRNRFYFDEFYDALIAHTQEALSRVANWVDRYLIGGLVVRGSSGTVDLVGRALRQVQSGSLQTYTFLLAVGVAIVLLVVFRRTF